MKFQKLALITLSFLLFGCDYQTGGADSFPLFIVEFFADEDKTIPVEILKVEAWKETDVFSGSAEADFSQNRITIADTSAGYFTFDILTEQGSFKKKVEYPGGRFKISLKL